MSRYARKRDSNERSIIEALRGFGCFVIQEEHIDLYVKPPHLPYWIPLEVKTPRGKLTAYQRKLHDTLDNNYGYKVPIVTTPEEALKAVGLLE